MAYTVSTSVVMLTQKEVSEEDADVTTYVAEENEEVDPEELVE